MLDLSATSIHTNSVSSSLFGGNILFDRDEVGKDGTYDDIVDNLGVSSMRYPGGSITEDYFDISNPNAVSTEGSSDLLPLNEFMAFAEDSGISVSIVLPTRDNLTKYTDANGDRYAMINENELRDFIKDVLDGDYGSAEITSFEIGNEYWGSGQMSAVEYGRVASEMTDIISDEIHSHKNYSTQFKDTDVLVQQGTNYGEGNLSENYDHLNTGEEQLEQFNADYGTNFSNDYVFAGGEVKWAQLSNELIAREFVEDGTIDKVDGIIAHVYSRGDGHVSSREYALTAIEDVWDQYTGDINIHVTEWNQSASDSKLDHEQDFGLQQSHELLNLVETFSYHEVEEAYVWPLQQNTANDLSGDEGDTNLTVAGEMFKMMSENLEGTHAVSFQATEGAETELSVKGADIHVFANEDKLVAFIASTDEFGADLDIDFDQLLEGMGSYEVSVLGVAEGENPSSTSSIAEVTNITRENPFSDRVLDAELDAYEIMMVTIANPIYTEEFMHTFADSLADMDDEFSAAETVAEIEGSEFDDLLDDGEDDDGTIAGIPTVAVNEYSTDAENSALDEEDDEDEEDDLGAGGCFVATFAYGNINHPDVTFLRVYRDLELKHKTFGPAFIGWYYKYGPYLADYAAQIPGARSVARWAIGKLVRHLKRSCGLH